MNKNKGKNFNSYINDLRINYILIKLKTEQKYRNYKVTSLAEECGFASHNTFVAAFRSVTGLSPASFINFLKREKNR
ncbi:helix-turn-helix domain-containing protein [Epilithonimonas ginsengisoli]|uniref:Helix-turn-helix domain-containing protein n=1 Tax=Epilithonimonas ginsengisoli TaxID=1245592 RepID=A0ABU4JFL2_9FLAO|nr:MULTISPECIES: helix-turn-helix domain-containing protein [Chryseobacterium group]MBV6879830.1 helix-turn-helix domain-containing protein [Epilithonimonas sp. FP105]MDW8548470.1 helix-turn-helix domain-containing protein [Epilithonimonas ginsengisoli]